MPIAMVRGLEINYQIIGEEGPFVALFTGGRRGYAEFIPLATRIAADGFRVLLHDRRNTGASGTLIAAAETEETTWADDLVELLSQLGAVSAFVGGSSSGARTAMLFCLRHPDITRGLLLLRVTGGAFAAGRLPENYYGRFIRAAEEGGMAAVCDTDAYSDRIAARPENREILMNMDPGEFIQVMIKLRDLFVAVAHLPVMGVTEEELGSITTPTIIIPGNDNTHSSASALAAHKMIPGSELHELPITDQDVPVISFDDWAEYVPEIHATFTDFMRRHF
jgi:pimeloyl-ACP methyl ester carboxylesterase